MTAMAAYGAADAATAALSQAASTDVAAGGDGISAAE